MGKKILFFQWNAFMQKDIEKILRDMPEIELSMISYEFKNVDEDELFMRRFPAELARDQYDAVFSVNFFPLVSDVCEQAGITYISWVYDSPMNVRRTSSYHNSVNRIYHFDRSLCDVLKAQGVANIFHKPLGADTGKIALMDTLADDAGDVHRLHADISFVGKLYSSEFDYMMRPLPEAQLKAIEEILAAQLFNYDSYLLTDFVNESYMDELNSIFKRATGDSNYTILPTQWEFLLASEVTRRERLAALRALSEKHRVTLYSYDTIPDSPGVDNRGLVNYYTEMPKVFHNSRINLNITLKIIKTGMPLRIMDILGAGGFLMSNRQKELEEFYRNGRDVLMYSNLAELCELSDYYLNHEEERAEIAQNGHKRTAELFELSKCLRDILL